MRYKTLLVHVDGSRHAPARFARAVQLCSEHGAHLIGAAMTGISRDVIDEPGSRQLGTLLAGYVDPLRANAQRALDVFERIARHHNISHESRLIHDTAPDALALLARFADLVVLSQDDPDESLGYLPPAVRMPDHVIYHAARPVLVVPCAASAPEGPMLPAGLRRILLCWNGSREASVAMAGAIALLQHAEQVMLAVLVSSSTVDGPSQQDIDDAIAFLKAHGVQAEPLLRTHTRTRSTGQALLKLASRQRCDAMVLGCFGRSQFQALLLGGASTAILRETPIPILMAR